MERDCDNFGMVAPLIDGSELHSIASRSSCTSSRESREQHSSLESNRGVDETIVACRDVSSSKKNLICNSTQTDGIQLDTQSEVLQETNSNLHHYVPIVIGEFPILQDIRPLNLQTKESDHQDEGNFQHEDSTKFVSKSDRQCTGKSPTKLQEMKSAPVLLVDSEDGPPSVSFREMRRSVSSAGCETEKVSYSDFRRHNSNILSTRKKKFFRRTTHLGGMELLKPRCDLEKETTDDLAQTCAKHDQIELSDANLNLNKNLWSPQNNNGSKADNFNDTPSGSNYQSQLSIESQFSDDSLTTQLQAAKCTAIAVQRYSVTAKKSDIDPISTTQSETVTPSRGRLVVLPREDDSFLPQNTSCSNLPSFEEMQLWKVTGLPVTKLIGCADRHRESISSSDSPPPLPDCSPPTFLNEQQNPMLFPHTNTSQSHDESEFQEKITFLAGYSHELPLTPSVNEALQITHYTDPITSSSFKENSNRQYLSNTFSRVSSEESEEKTSSVGSNERKSSLESLKITSSADSSISTFSEEFSCEISFTDTSSKNSQLALPDRSSTESLNFIAPEFPGLPQSSYHSITCYPKSNSTTSSIIESPNANTYQTIPLSAMNEDGAVIPSGDSPSMKNMISETGATEQISTEFSSIIKVSPVDTEIIKSATASDPDTEYNVTGTETVRKSHFNDTSPFNTVSVDAIPSERAEQTNSSLKNVLTLSPDTEFNVIGNETVKKSQFNDTTPVNIVSVDAIPSERAEQTNSSLENVTALSPDTWFNVTGTETVRKSQFNDTTPVNTVSVDAIPPERAEQTNESLKDRRVETHHLRPTLNFANERIHSDPTIDIPPPIPPKSDSFGKKDASKCFPHHVSADRRGSSWNMDDRKSPQDCPPDLPPKRPCSYQNRRCCSTLIDSNSISRNLFFRSNSTETTVNIEVQSTSSSPVLSKICDASVVEMDVPPSLIQKNLTVAPPPRPPSMYRSFSHNEESMEKSAMYIFSSESGVKSEPPTIGKKYGELLKSNAFIEARNMHVQRNQFLEHLASSFTKLNINTEARLQHFPVKLASTHHRCSEVSPGWPIVTSPASESKMNKFKFPDCGVYNRMSEDDDYHETRISSDGSDQQDSASCLQLDYSETINEGMSIRDSQTESDEFSPRVSKHLTTTRQSARFSREIPMHQTGGSIRSKKVRAESSADLLQDEHNMGFDSRFDISQVGVTEVSEQPTTKTAKSKISLPQISKVSLQVVSDNLKLHFGKMSASASLTAKKEQSEEADQFRRSQSDRLLRKEREKANASRNKSMSIGVPAFLRFSITRDPSTVRGVPSDLNPLMDSAIQAIEEERRNISLDSSTDNLISSSDRGRKPGRWDRRSSSGASDSLRFSNHHETRSSKSSGENTDPSSSDNFSIVSFVSDQIDGRPEEYAPAPLFSRQESRINSLDNSDWNVEGINHSIKGLIRDMERYTEVLRDLHETYSIMRSKTPDGIRQRFDLAFKEIQLMIQLQNEINSVVAVSENDFGSIAEVFKKKEFSVYKRYTVLANNIQKDMKSYAAYFRENFTDLATKIMVPSTRLNVYAQHLRGFLNHFCSDSRHSLQEAITYLETLKDQANTEMTINVIQNCPVELRLVGLIRHVGEMHYEGDSLSRKLYYIILFDSILIITDNKYDFFTYKQHIRCEQLVEVQEHGLSRLLLKVCPNYLNDVVTYKFRTVTSKDRNTWISILKNWQDTNRPSYNNTVIHQDLISQLDPKPERFWPLSLWLISPRLEEAINVVKHQEKPKAPPRRSNVDIFNEFVKLEEDFVEKLNILLDPESMPPPAILGSVLRKIRRFHKAQFLPKLKKAYANEPSSILDCIIGNLPNLPCLYKEFIEVRAGLTLTMIDGDHVRLYISPFQHLAAYIEWLYEVSCMPRYHSHLRGQLNILLNSVEDARVSLLHIAIPNCRMDYYKAGDILHRGSLESKVKSKNVKSNQNYYVILFEKVLMYTRLRMPSYEFVQAVWLDQLTLGPPTECKKTFKIEERLHKKELVYELRAESVMQRNLWVEKIVGVLQKRALAIKKKVSAGRV